MVPLKGGYGVCVIEFCHNGSSIEEVQGSPSVSLGPGRQIFGVFV